MTKREKMLLQIMICIGVVGVLAVYVLLPQIKKNRALNEDFEEVSFQADEMAEMLALPGVEDGLEAAEATTENTWSFFQKGLSSYEIDDFINNLAEKNDLEIVLLSIGSYKEVSDTELGMEPAMATVISEDALAGSHEVEDMLLSKVTVIVKVEGDYQDVLKFIDNINERSECIIIKDCVTFKDETELRRDEEDNVIEDFEYLSAQITLDMYSIISYDQWRENAATRTPEEISGEDLVW